ncbi:hypothetical protein F383_36081 [Gossypium arboreum]|uniref:Uncharacterized protein n=1 Tax=Gossypium arboreum TaxID=29729 RepID=A0A0B0N882_GOSAR|nr:hypothetical protein F383_36081 [Gossypium arboreum]
MACIGWILLMKCLILVICNLSHAKMA